MSKQATTTDKDDDGVPTTIITTTPITLTRRDRKTTNRRTTTTTPTKSSTSSSSAVPSGGRDTAMTSHVTTSRIHVPNVPPPSLSHHDIANLRTAVTVMLLRQRYKARQQQQQQRRIQKRRIHNDRSKLKMKDDDDSDDDDDTNSRHDGLAKKTKLTTSPLLNVATGMTKTTTTTTTATTTASTTATNGKNDDHHHHYYYHLQYMMETSVQQIIQQSTSTAASNNVDSGLTEHLYRQWKAWIVQCGCVDSHTTTTTTTMATTSPARLIQELWQSVWDHHRDTTGAAATFVFAASERMTALCTVWKDMILFGQSRRPQQQQHQHDASFNYLVKMLIASIEFILRQNPFLRSAMGRSDVDQQQHHPSKHHHQHHHHYELSLEILLPLISFYEFSLTRNDIPNGDGHLMHDRQHCELRTHEQNQEIRLPTMGLLPTDLHTMWMAEYQSPPHGGHGTAATTTTTTNTSILVHPAIAVAVDALWIRHAVGTARQRAAYHHCHHHHHHSTATLW